jgi:tetratricopeptide (TPR) repeat protein
LTNFMIFCTAVFLVYTVFLIAFDTSLKHAPTQTGYVRHQQGDYAGALEVNQECLRLRREAKGEMDEEVAATLTHIAIVLLKMDMSEMALEVLEEAYRIHKGLNNVGRDLAFTLYQMGLIHHTAGAHDLALSYYLETARVEKTALGKAHRDLSITYYNLAQIYFHRGDMELALDNFREALSIERECFGNDHPTCARTLNEMANIELQIGSTKEMMEYYAEALRIYKGSGLGEDHLVIYGQALWRFDLVHPMAAATA